MLVTYNASHHRMVPKSHHPDAKDHEDIILAPGLNDVPDEEWEEAKSLPVIEHLLEEEILVEEKTSKNRPAKDLTQMPLKRALKVIKDTIDEELLLEASKKAKGELLEAIEAQLELLKATEPPQK